MPSVDYIWEKVLLAVTSLAEGTGSFEERLSNAYMAALANLTSNDATAALAEDLNWVLLKCQNHLIPGEGKMRPFDEMDRRKIVEKLVHLLIETTRAEED